jgi:hypothetical protein
VPDRCSAGEHGADRRGSTGTTASTGSGAPLRSRTRSRRGRLAQGDAVRLRRHERGSGYGRERLQVNWRYATRSKDGSRAVSTRGLILGQRAHESARDPT